MDLSSHFKFEDRPAPLKTIQLELSGGGAHGAYECGALDVLIPFFHQQGYRIDIVTGVSAGAVNAVLLSSALNSDRDSTSVMNSFWDKIAAKGDLYLGPLLHMHSLTRKFNFFATDDGAFPNIPHHYMSAMQMGGKSSLPLTQLKTLLRDHIGDAGWDNIRTGPTQTVVNAVHLDRNGTRTPVLFTRTDLTPETVIASAALRDFAPYHIKGERYEDGGYDRIGFFLKDHKTDVLFAIGLKSYKTPQETQDHRGVKTGQLHHDLAHYYLDPDRICHIDFLCMNQPAHWNETSAMNNTSENINLLRDMGRGDALRWIENHGATFGTRSSFRPHDDLIRHLSTGAPKPMAA